MAPQDRVSVGLKIHGPTRACGFESRPRHNSKCYGNGSPEHDLPERTVHLSVHLSVEYAYWMVRAAASLRCRNSSMADSGTRRMRPIVIESSSPRETSSRTSESLIDSSWATSGVRKARLAGRVSELVSSGRRRATTWSTRGSRSIATESGGGIDGSGRGRAAIST